MSGGAEIVAELRRACRPAGLDLVAPLSVAAYNARVDADWRLPAFDRPDALGVVIGNTRALWAPFLAALRREPARLDHPHPLDDYVRERVEAARAGTGPRSIVRWADGAPPHGVALQHAAEVAGLTWRSPANLSVHPVYGPWIALRAVVVFDLPPPPAPPPAPACDACEVGCRPAFEAARRTAPGRRPGAADVIAAWRRWVAVRDACPRGHEHRYGDDQIAYHYRRDPGILRALVAAEGGR